MTGRTRMGAALAASVVDALAATRAKYAIASANPGPWSWNDMAPFLAQLAHNTAEPF